MAKRISRAGVGLFGRHRLIDYRLYLHSIFFHVTLTFRGTIRRALGGEIVRNTDIEVKVPVEILKSCKFDNVECGV